jgi:hypothetical protein
MDKIKQSTEEFLKLKIKQYKNNLKLLDNNNIKYTRLKCNYGGYRYFLICPLCHKNYTWLGEYKHKDKVYYFCRKCLNLNYESSQNSKLKNKEDKLQNILYKLNYRKTIYKMLIELLYKPTGLLSGSWSGWHFSVVTENVSEINRMPKPKNMHNKTFKTLKNEAIELIEDILFTYYERFKRRYKEEGINEFYENRLKILEDCDLRNKTYMVNGPQNAYRFYSSIKAEVDADK